LLVAVTSFVLLASISRVPYPVFLVVGGLALSLVPGLPAIELPPDLVFLIFLPPLLYSAAFFSSPRDLKAQIRPIALLSIGLVLLTTVTVAVVGHVAIGLSWPVAFVLGVIVSPTDPVTVASTAERLGLPRNIITILEGESLINDGTALALYRTAVAAVVAGSFSILNAGLEFVLSGIGGAAIGLAVGWMISRVRWWVEDPLVETTIALLTGYAAYLPAEELGASGVIAVVVTGLYLSWQSPKMTSPRNRLQVFEVLWVMDFLLNSVLFILIGLQLSTISGELSGESPAMLVLYALLVSSAVIITRLVWTFPMAYLPHYLSRRMRERNPFPPWRQVTFVSYAGMRGGVSLAAALSLPLTVGSGEPFPGRDLVIFLTFCVILVTLVLQGLNLPLLVRRLGLEDDGEEEHEENEARLKRIIDAVPHIVWSALPDGYNDFHNQRWYEFSGLPLGSGLGDNWRKTLHPEDQDRTWAEWQHSLATGEPSETEYRLRDHSGEYRWALGRAFRLRPECPQPSRSSGRPISLKPFNLLSGTTHSRRSGFGETVYIG